MSSITKTGRTDTCYLVLQDSTSCHAAIVTSGHLQRSARLSHRSPVICFGTGSDRMLKVWRLLPKAWREPERFQHPSKNAAISPSVFSAAKSGTKSEAKIIKSSGNWIFLLLFFIFQAFKRNLQWLPWHFSGNCCSGDVCSLLRVSTTCTWFITGEFIIIHFKKGPQALLVTPMKHQQTFLFLHFHLHCTLLYFLNFNKITIILYNVLQTWCRSAPLSVQLLINKRGPSGCSER